MHRPIAVALIALLALGASPQGINPVYVDDSTAARDTLSRLPELVNAGNLSESVRSLQRLLDSEPHRALELPGDSDIFVTVRRRVHDAILADPALLDAYRQTQGPVADLLLSRAEHARLETSNFLTRAGAIGTLRIAQGHLEASRFEAARLTLAPLAAHPDRDDPEIAQAAASLASQIAGYLDRPSTWTWAEGFAARARALAPPRKAIAHPPLLNEPIHSAFERGDRPVIGDMVWTPIRSSPFSTRGTNDRDDAIEQVRRATGAAPMVEPAWAFPTIAGETIYLNDGATIAALDRFTLEERWRTRPLDAEARYEPLEFGRRPNDRAYSRGFDDGNTVTLTRGMVLATTGVASGNGRSGDPRIHAIDRDTGRVVWSVDVIDLDPQLLGGSVRGPLLVDGTTVIAAVRKHVPQRRLVSIAMVGIDLRDGTLLWTTTIGSAGIQSTSRGGRSTEGAALYRGIVYRTDEVGVISALEASSGRIVWIRRIPSTTLINTVAGWPWGTVMPLIDEGADEGAADGKHAGGLVTLTPDRLDLVRLDLETGRLQASRSVGALEQARYLVRIGPDLAAVGDRRIAFVDFADFDTAQVRTSVPLEGDAGSMTGRVFDAGGLLAAPTRSGLVLIDPKNPREPISAPLERTGNLALADGQVVVVDHREIHSYLVWDVASGLLRERVDRAGDDAGPAITFADLASRSRRWAEVVPALDRAIEVAERTAGSPSSEDARRRVVALLESLIGASAIGWSADAPPSDLPGTTPRIDDLALLDALVDRLGRVCSSPDEQVTHAMAAGRLRAAQSRVGEAIEIYQRVLANPSLANAIHRTPGLSIRAATEATSRLRALVLSAGPRAYELFDIEARDALLRAPADPDQLAQIADRYPASPVVVAALRRAAASRLQSGDVSGALRDLRAAASFVEWATLAGVVLDPTDAPEIAGATILALAESDATDALELAAARFARWPGVAPTLAGRPVDVGAALLQARARMAERSRLARVGTPSGAEVAQALVGWTLAQSVSAERDGSPTLALMISADGKAVAGFGPAQSSGSVTEIWRRPCELPPRVLWQDAEAIYLQWIGADGGTIERIDPRTGKAVWTSPRLRTLFPLDAQSQRRMLDQIGRPLTIATPTAGTVALTDLLVALDGNTLVLAERAGRLASINAGTGAVRYATRTPVDRIYEVAIGAGIIVVGGSTERQIAPDQPIELKPVMASLDAHADRVLSVATDLPGDIMWLRLDAEANTLAGFEEGIISANSESGRRSWTRYRDAAERIVDAWVMGPSIFMLDNTRALWLADAATGQMQPDPLRSDDRLGTRQRVVGRKLGDRLAFCSPRGVVIYDAAGRRVGADAISASDSLLPAQAGADALVTIDTRPTESPEGRRTYTLSVLDTSSARLVASRELALLMPPDGLALLDGHILVSASGVTLVIAAPEP